MRIEQITQAIVNVAWLIALWSLFCRPVARARIPAPPSPASIPDPPDDECDALVLGCHLAAQIKAVHFDAAMVGKGFVIERSATVRVGGKLPVQVIVRAKT